MPPKASFEFVLPEEQEELNMCLKASSYKCALNDIANEVFRPHRKHGYSNPALDTEASYDIIEILETMFYQILSENEVDL